MFIAPQPPKGPIQPPEPEADPGPDKVILWRAEQLERAGYNAMQAAALAVVKDVDLHKAASLLAAGCDPCTAVDILL